MDDSSRFILSHTAVAAAALVPELHLHLATEVTPLWEATEAALARSGLPPPYWAFAWPGGQAVARFVLDHRERVAGRRVLDFAAGSGLAALAAARAGAARTAASDTDALARTAMALNAALNGLSLEIWERDVIGLPVAGFDLVLAGDICYEQPMAGRALAWLRTLAAGGTEVILGDPGRTYAPRDGLDLLARYTVPTSLDLEDRTARETAVWRVLPAG